LYVHEFAFRSLEIIVQVVKEAFKEEPESVLAKDIPPTLQKKFLW
jgi:hypothetical protein